MKTLLAFFYSKNDVFHRSRKLHDSRTHREFQQSDYAILTGKNCFYAVLFELCVCDSNNAFK